MRLAAPIRNRRAAVLVAAVALVVLGACGEDDGGAISTTTSVPTSATPSTPSTPSSPTTSASTTASSQGSSSTTTEPLGTVIEVAVAGGSVQGGVQRASVHLGDLVTIRVTSDVADEVHVHTYDLKQDVEAGATATITFTAEIPGVFDVELESAGLQILELEVS